MSLRGGTTWQSHESVEFLFLRVRGRLEIATVIPLGNCSCVALTTYIPVGVPRNDVDPNKFHY